MLVFSRLEQFQISVYDLGFVCFSNSGLFVFLAVLGILLFFQNFYSLNLIPNYGQGLVEMFVLFMFGVIKEQMGLTGLYLYGPFLLSLFVLILIFNLVGLVPFTFTVTSHIAISLGCSLGLFLGVIMMGFWNHSESYLDIFLRLGVPLGLQPALIYLEVLGFLAKAFSLGVSLTANMLAGHTLLKLASMLVFGVFSSSFKWLVFMPFMGLVLLAGLETVISFVQAYVFIVLICSALSDWKSFCFKL